MEKYLFTDGISGIREAESDQALQNLINASEQTQLIRIWICGQLEWKTYAAFTRDFPVFIKKETIQETEPVRSYFTETVQPVRRKRRQIRWLLLPVLAGAAFLIFNFTRIRWEKTTPLHYIAVRPENVPLMNIDSLINDIEFNRGQSLDHSTRTNLRLRNTWPDLVELKLQSERETSSAGTRYSQLQVQIDNNTGNVLDNALVRLQVWEKGQPVQTDTLRFSNIQYDKALIRPLDAVYKGDSISVAFESLQSRGFNFCYSASLKNRAGNYADRWFCR